MAFGVGGVLLHYLKNVTHKETNPSALFLGLVCSVKLINIECLAGGCFWQLQSLARLIELGAWLVAPECGGVPLPLT